MQASFIVMFALIAFGIYRRIRRNIGWQPFQPRRMWFRIGILALVGLLFFAAGWTHPVSLVSDFVGLAVGGALGYYGDAHTLIENRDGILQYRPNVWIGGAVTVLFVGRIAYRMYNGYGVANQAASQSAPRANGFQNFSQNMGATASWATGLSLIVFAYYVVYYGLLLRRRRREIPSA